MAKDTIPKYEDTVPAYDNTLSTDDKQSVVNYLQHQQPGMGEAILGGAQQGLTLSHTPQISGVMGAALEKGADLVGQGTGDNKSLVDLYHEYKQAARKRLDEAEKTHPNAFTAGTLGGGTLGALGGGMALKAAGLGAGAAAGAGEAAEAAPTMAARLRQGAAIGAGAGAVSAEGNSDAPYLSGQMAADVLQGAEGGAIAGAALTPAVAAVAGAGRAVGAGVGKLARSTFPDVAENFRQGFGKEGPGSERWLIGPEGATQTAEQSRTMSAEFPQVIDDLASQQAQLKHSVINEAAEKGVRVDPKKIDAFVERFTGNEPNSIESDANAQLKKLQDLIKNAKNGREVTRVTRQALEENGLTERQQFAKDFAMKQAEEQAKLEPDAPAPATQKEQFEQLFKQKQAEQRAVPGSDPSPLEIHYEPIEGDPDHVLGIIRQPVIRDDAQSFTGFKPEVTDPHTGQVIQQQEASSGDMSGGTPEYRKIATQKIAIDQKPQNLPQLQMEIEPLADSPGQNIGIIKRAVLDEKGNVVGYKIVKRKLLNADEAAEFKEVAETVRMDDRDLSDPRQLLDLYYKLNRKGQFGEKAFSNPEAEKEAGRASQAIKDMLRGKVDKDGQPLLDLNGNPIESGVLPELRQVDSKISNANSALESAEYGDNMKDSSRNLLLSKLIDKSLGVDETAVEAKLQLEKLVEHTKNVDPEYGVKLEKQIGDMQQLKRATEGSQQKAYAARPISTPAAWGNRIGNSTGYMMAKMTPDVLREISGKLLSMGASEQSENLARILSKAAEKDAQYRNSVMFGLMQNAGYRKMLEPYMNQNEDNK